MAEVSQASQTKDANWALLSVPFNIEGARAHKHRSVIVADLACRQTKTKKLLDRCKSQIRPLLKSY